MKPEKEAILNKLYAVSPIGIEVIDIRGRRLICASNWTAEHIGYTMQEFSLLSENLFEKIVHPDDRTKQLDAYQALIDHPEAVYKEFTVRVKKKDNTYAFAQLRLSVLELDTDNKPKTILATAMDVTQIIHLQKRLDEELKKIDLISYKNSHELRGPVATILGLIQLIDHDGLDGVNAKEIISCLKKTVAKLDEVVHDINSHAL